MTKIETRPLRLPKVPGRVERMGHKTVQGPLGSIVVKEKCPTHRTELTKNGYCRKCKQYYVHVLEW